ncbi:ribulose-phosphate 3-epimerase [Brevibacillus daliensis]|uniref:ribulose-phosphate 3-epimerase n=1 Tax=Brevibacillus daliensis TaxID=2892995 RepID=UPI001E2D90B0|nr:ribulose-phosphate 3-epimerase [Brevibacillus daliensis]
MITIGASIMCADQLNLKQEIDRLEQAKIDYLHCDVMDGQYVHNLAMGPYVLEQIKEYTSIPLDIHLAMVRPERFLREFIDLGPGIISVHAESTPHLHRAISMIRDHGIKASVALNPSSPISYVKEIIHLLDMVLVMTVDPGFAGQRFVRATLPKIAELKQLCEDKGLDNMLIQIDGNIHSGTIPEAVAAGANFLVGGTSAIFKGPDSDYGELVAKMRTCV